METISNAANAAASYLGYDQTDKAAAGETLGELVQDKQGTSTAGTAGTTQGGLSSRNPYSSTSQSGTEPISGKLGAGTAGQPYDAGNYEETSGSAAGLTSGTSGTSGLGNKAGFESTSGYGNNTGYQDSTSRGIGADATQQGNHYTSTTVAGKLGSAMGLDATRRVDDGSSSTTTGGNYSSSNTHASHSSGRGLGGVGDVGSSGYHTSGLGSDRSAVLPNDRYLFNASNAPGAGGCHVNLTDDFTDSNIHHEGHGRITGDVGSDASSGKPGLGAATGLTGSHSGTGLTSDKGKDRTRKPGYERMGSGLSYGNSSHGLNSGGQRESIGTKLERGAESAGLAGAGAGAAYGASHSGREPLSGQRGSGIGGEPYDQGNKYDGTSQTTTSGQGYQNETRRAGDAGEPYGVDTGVNQATSGVSGLNIRDNKYSGDQGPYGTSSRTSGVPGASGSQSQTSTSGFGLAGATLAGSTRDRQSNPSDYATPTGPGLTSTGERGNGDGRDFGATAPRNANDSTLGAGGLKERVAGAPNPNSDIDECEAGHHKAHAVGEQAHVDGSHKPTFLNYQHDQFGIPGAKGE